MKKFKIVFVVLTIAVIAMSLSACVDEGDTTNTSDDWENLTNKNFYNIYRYYDSELGVACYKVIGKTDAISCVKVAEGDFEK